MELAVFFFMSEKILSEKCNKLIQLILSFASKLNKEFTAIKKSVVITILPDF